MAASSSSATAAMDHQHGNEQVKNHYDKLLGRTYTWWVWLCVGWGWGFCSRADGRMRTCVFGRLAGGIE